MPYVTIDCRKQDRTFATREQAVQWLADTLHHATVGTVAAVWEGGTQTVGMQVRRVNGRPHIIGRSTWPGPTPGPWTTYTRHASPSERTRVTATVNRHEERA